MSVTTSRTTKSRKIGTGQTYIQRTTNGGKASSSIKTRTKVGDKSWVTQTCGPRGYTTTHSTRSGDTTYSTSDRRDIKKPIAYKSPKNPKSSRSSSRSRSSDDTGNMITALCVGFVVAIFAGIVWLFSWMFGSSKESESE